MDLLSVKTPITDADSIRALACKALLGLARSENARQIMGKLPLFTSGQLQVLSIEFCPIINVLFLFTVLGFDERTSATRQKAGAC